jgi:hypothetical protein
MRRALYSAISLILLTAAFVVPVHANGIANGKTMTIAVAGLPDICPTGAVMHGRAGIQLLPDGSQVKQVVTIEVTVRTPWGDASVFTHSFKMLPGTTRTVPLAIPVPSNVPPGEYYLDFNVTTKLEELNVGHEVQIVPNT